MHEKFLRTQVSEIVSTSDSARRLSCKLAEMPRAFLITHRRYNPAADGEQRESSPEHKVTLPESSLLYLPRPISPSPTDCPDDLYNLTKLAEVSLAAASGQLYHHRHLSTLPFPSPSLAPPSPPTTNVTGYTHKLFDRDRDRSGVVQQAAIGGEQAKSGENGGGINGDKEQHECPDCGKRYSTSSNLARHRQTHRSLADKKARRCPHCDKVYVSMPAYSMHVRTHVQGCRCPYCGKCFSRPWLLQGHIRTHTGEKPFRCPQCSKAFADKSNLRAHVQTHSDTKPHVCLRCGKAFALKSYLYKHEESSCMRQKPGVPTPVIVRNVVSSEKAVEGKVERGGVIAGRCCVEVPVPQPVDFSKREYEKRGEYIGMPIAV